MSSPLLSASKPPRWKMPRAREDQGPNAQEMLGLSSPESQSQVAPGFVSSLCKTKEEPLVSRLRESQPQGIEDAKLFSKEESRPLAQRPLSCSPKWLINSPRESWQLPSIMRETGAFCFVPSAPTFAKWLELWTKFPSSSSQNGTKRSITTTLIMTEAYAQQHTPKMTDINSCLNLPSPHRLLLPPQDINKINVDVAIRCNASTIEVIARDYSGSNLFSFGDFGPPISATVGEAKVILKALQIAKVNG
ncbi:uncharacterized protein A4U43_C07F830 [Asparagus officinalis]|uniref:Uncharacterized protein n=1 Tax=Asparagus officinalis TaxID=4686 RepID=A0A5P1E8B8_ASPOF|nr:uncharacterized protein A4U43_C07F830 [Asparagus officinalis]